MFSNNRISAKIGKFYFIFAEYKNLIMKKLYFLCVFILATVSGPVFLSGQEIPVLPDDPSVRKGILPDGISYYLVPNPSDKGVADFALVRKDADAATCRRLLDSLPAFAGRRPSDFLADNGIHPGKKGYVQERDGDVVLLFSDVRLPSGEEVTDSLMLMMFGMAGADSRSSGDAIVISGDVDSGVMEMKLKMLSLMVHSGGTDSRSPVPAWTARDTAVCGVEYSAGLPVSRLSVAYRAPGTPEKYMGTAVPSVMKRFGEEFGHVLCRRLERQFRLDSIPLAGLRYRHDGTFSRKGEESFIVTVLTSGEYVGKAASVTGAVLSSLDGAGASVAEFRDARNVASCAAESRARSMKVSNGYYMEKCISSFLYGAGLASLQDQASFYKASFRDSSGCRLFNRFMSELIDSAANLSISCRTGNPDVTGKSLLRSFRQGWSYGGADIIPYPVNYSDSLSLNVPDTRCPVRRTRNTGIDGARMWIFSNGTKVVYRKMPTDGMLYYSFVLRGGYSSMKGMKDGEGAFLSDMLGLCGPQTMAPGNFRPLLAACGISMTPSVSLSNISLSGSLPRDRASLLMKSLVSLSSGMTLDKRTVADYLAEERMRLSTVKGEYSGRLFVLDSVICGTDRYSPYKSVSNLHDDLPARALRFFRTEFSQADDGVLIFVGDIPEHEFRKFLQSYMGGFKTVGKRVLKSAVSFHTGSGESTYFVEGSIPGVDVLMSAALPMNPSNFMASRVAVAALEDAMSSCLRDDAVTFSIKNRFAVYPHERLGILVSVRPAQSSSLPYGVEKASPVKLLMDIRSAVSDLAEAPLPEERMAFYRTVVRNRWDSLQADPEYWIRVMSGRFAGGKNVSSGYGESIQEVTASDVNKVFRLLDEGGSVEYVTKIKGYGVRDDNPDR